MTPKLSRYDLAVRQLTARKSFDLALAVLAPAAALLFAAVVLPPAAPGAARSAAAANCSDVDVVFARGRFESAGPGTLGNAFINSLSSKIGGRSMNTYAVKYPADSEIDIGANDMSRHVSSVMNNCPNTRIVLGGYSLGAAVTDVVLAVPFSAFGFNSPLPEGADQHVAAVALFGNGSAWAGPITNFNPIYNDRTIELCHGADPICNPADPNTWKENWPQHLASAYVDAGMANQAADFVAGKL
ncbi:MAG: cutinase [Mycobacterium sp.]|nr:cutinase [Mycobacterium sp.]